MALLANELNLESLTFDRPRQTGRGNMLVYIKGGPRNRSPSIELPALRVPWKISEYGSITVSLDDEELESAALRMKLSALDELVLEEARKNWLSWASMLGAWNAKPEDVSSMYKPLLNESLLVNFRTDEKTTFWLGKGERCSKEDIEAGSICKFICTFGWLHFNKANAERNASFGLTVIANQVWKVSGPVSQDAYETFLFRGVE